MIFSGDADAEGGGPESRNRKRASNAMIYIQCFHQVLFRHHDGQSISRLVTNSSLPLDCYPHFRTSLGNCLRSFIRSFFFFFLLAAFFFLVSAGGPFSAFSVSWSFGYQNERQRLYPCESRRKYVDFSILCCNSLLNVVRLLIQGANAQDIGHNAKALLNTFLVLHISSSHIGLPLLVITFLFSKNAKRHPTVINVCISWILSGISSIMLWVVILMCFQHNLTVVLISLYAGQNTGPEPGKALCRAQTSLMYGTWPMSVLAYGSPTQHWCTTHLQGALSRSLCSSTIFGRSMTVADTNRVRSLFTV
jgi:hypothetical protein